MELYKDKEWLKSKLDKTNLEIAKECGCSKSTIRYWIEKFGLSRNDKGSNTYKNKEQLEKDWEELKQYQNIGPTMDEYFENLEPVLLFFKSSNF